MKILSFSYCFPNNSNKNWGIFVFNRLKAMSKYCDLKVASPSPYFPVISSSDGVKKENFNSLEVHRPDFFYFPLILKNSDPFFYALGIKSWFNNLLDEWEPDFIDSHFVWPDGVGVYYLAKKKKIPYSITLRGKIYESLKNQKQTKLCQKALVNADRVISVSGLMADEAIKLGVKKDKIKIVPNGIDPDIFYPRDKKTSRIKLGLPIDKKIIVTIAHLGHRKGHFEVIKALKNIKQDYLLVLVGAEAQGGTKKDIINAAKKEGIEKKLILTGPRPYDEIPYYFSAADLSILASYREGCPNSVIESLSCGVPVAASDVGAVPDILKIPQCGKIFPAKSVKDIEESINQLLDKDFSKEEVIKNSKIKSWNQIGKEIILDFQNLI